MSEPDSTNAPSQPVAATAVAQAQPPAGPKPPSRTRKLVGSVREWLLRTQALRDARRPGVGMSETQRAHLVRARQTCETADHAVNQVEPLQSGLAFGAAVSLYREGAFWALTALCPTAAGAKTLAEAFELADPSVLAKSAGGEAGVPTVRAALVQRSFVETAERTDAEQQDDAIHARMFVRALVAKLEARHTEPLLRRQRRRRLGFAVIVLSIAIASCFHFILRKPNFADGKPWRTSTSYGSFDPVTHVVEGRPSDLLFHTLSEDSPWFEVDLGKPMVIKQVELKNRSDCCAERAVPLVVETSLDGTGYQEVARRMELFDSWVAKFGPTSARYVRVRALHKTVFHLEDVKVR